MNKKYEVSISVSEISGNCSHSPWRLEAQITEDPEEMFKAFIEMVTAIGRREKTGKR